jgi:hypothetical protein
MLPVPSGTTYQKTKCLINKEVTGEGALFIEHALYHDD